MKKIFQYIWNDMTKDSGWVAAPFILYTFFIVGITVKYITEGVYLGAFLWLLGSVTFSLIIGRIIIKNIDDDDNDDNDDNERKLQRIKVRK